MTLVLCRWLNPFVGSDDEEFPRHSVMGAVGILPTMTLRRKLSRDGFTDKAEVTDTESSCRQSLNFARLFDHWGRQISSSGVARQDQSCWKSIPGFPPPRLSVQPLVTLTKDAMALDYFWTIGTLHNRCSEGACGALYRTSRFSTDSVHSDVMAITRL